MYSYERCKIGALFYPFLTNLTHMRVRGTLQPPAQSPTMTRTEWIARGKADPKLVTVALAMARCRPVVVEVFRDGASGVHWFDDPAETVAFYEQYKGRTLEPAKRAAVLGTSRANLQ